MQYLISFLEGIISFISPCLLPLLPVYIAYFAADTDSARETSGGAEKPEGIEQSEGQSGRALRGALGFVLGFTLVFTALGAFAGTLGALLHEHQTAVNIIGGAIVIVFGLNYLGVLNIGFLNATRQGGGPRAGGFFSALLFGAVFSMSWTPCVGAFLGSALLLASQQGTALRGMLMLLCYSAGLGLPFILSAVLIERLRGAFDFIKKHYNIINKVCGLLLTAVGVLMMTGRLSALLTALSAA
ncbi:MAG: cytochrome c biogenesis protein CcdA [Oscillospiraceae bacterium]|nr:cytochrome c biogenesis protein CcdA [Oscillospiraceae bacterium]